MLLSLSLLIILNSYAAHARPEYFTWWQEVYPSSNSDNAVCQICHERSGGGQGWNVYGWDIKSVLEVNRMGIPGTFANEEEALKASIDDIEATFDGGISSYLGEINLDAQPGWREGSVNVIQYDAAPDSTVAPPNDFACGVLVDPGSEATPCPLPNPFPSSIPKSNIKLKLETVAAGFKAPVYTLPAPVEPGFMYVVEQAGKIIRVNLATGIKQEFLDFSHKVVSSFSSGYEERGLLGFAFHPDYATNSKVYTYISQDLVPEASVPHFSTMPDGITADHLSVVSEWVVSAPQSNPAHANSEKVLLIVEQPQANHNGGMLSFGPDDLFYISLGDGGAASDKGDGHGANGNGRDNLNPLGAILRIDVDTLSPANGRYAIPIDNPFVGLAGLDEIYIYGLRNPYRFSFEALTPSTFNLYVGDVGQNAIEEVNRISSAAIGGNYGWNYKEGSFFFYSDPELGNYVSTTPPPGVMLPPLVDPIAEYDHDEGLSVIGGHVYTGDAIPTLQGRYVFADWGSSFSIPNGRLFYLDESDSIREFALDQINDNYITGIGKDLAGELYFVGSDSAFTAGVNGVLKKLTLGASEMCLPIKTKAGTVTVICL